MEVIHLLIPPDSVHVRIQPFSDREPILLQRQAFPLGQGMDDLRVGAGFLNVEFNRTFHAVEVVVQSRMRFNKQRSRNPFERKRLRKAILKRPLQQSYGALGLVHRQRRPVAVRHIHFTHRHHPFRTKNKGAADSCPQRLCCSVASIAPSIGSVKRFFDFLHVFYFNPAFIIDYLELKALIFCVYEKWKHIYCKTILTKRRRRGILKPHGTKAFIS